MQMGEEKPTIVVILGATGVGKSRLAIDLACRFPGEVISADSMQVYKGLDILTNKVTEEEKKGIPHHLLGVIEPNEEFTARQFRDLAIPIIDDILKRGKLPIVVGGTNYYIQALVSSYLLDDFLKENQDEEVSKNNQSRECKQENPLHTTKQPPESYILNTDEGTKVGRAEENPHPLKTPCAGQSHETDFIKDDDISKVDETKETKQDNDVSKLNPPMESKENHGKPLERTNNVQPTIDLYEQLKQIDEEMALTVHPHNIRKINHYINLYHTTGKKPSDLLKAGNLDKWGSAGTFRYNCCFICLDAEVTDVDRYVDNRVDAMIQAGLLDEVSQFYAPGADFTRGLRQAIGVPEFSSLFDKLSFKAEKQSGPKFLKCILESGKAIKISVDDGCNYDKKYTEAVMNAARKMKANTRKLVRVQRRRLNKLENQFGWHLNRVDVTNVLRSSGSAADDLWLNEVLAPSITIVEQALNPSKENSDHSSENLIKRSPIDRTESRKRFVCEVCNGRIFIGLHQWQEHINGRSHKRKFATMQKP